MLDKKISNNSTNISLYFMAMIIPKGVSFVLLPILSRYMTAGDFGIVNYCHNVSTIYAGLAAFGLNVYYLRFYQKHSDEIDSFSGSLFFAMLIWNIFLFFIFGGAFSVFFRKLNVGFSFWPYMFFQLLAQFLYNVEIIPSRTLRMQKRVPLYMISSILSSASIAVFSVFFVVFLQKGAAGRLVSEILAALIVAVFLVFSVRKNLKITIKKDFIKEGLKFSLPLLPGELFVKLTNVSGTVIIERFVQLSALGVFSIAQYFSTIIEMILNSISLAIEPELMAVADEVDYYTRYLSYKRLYMLITFFLALLVGVFAEECISIFFPPSYIEAWRFIQLLCVACVLSTLNNIFSWFNYAQLKTWVRSVSVISSSILSIVTIILLAPVVGIYATAISLILARLITTFISFIFISKEKSLNMFGDAVGFLILGGAFFVVYIICPMPLHIKIFVKLFVCALSLLIFFILYDIKLTYLYSFLRKKWIRK